MTFYWTTLDYRQKSLFWHVFGVWATANETHLWVIYTFFLWSCREISSVTMHWLWCWLLLSGCCYIYLYLRQILNVVYLLCTVEMRREYKQENALLLIPQGCRESRLCCKHWKFHNDLQKKNKKYCYKIPVLIMWTEYEKNFYKYQVLTNNKWIYRINRWYITTSPPPTPHFCQLHTGKLKLNFTNINYSQTISEFVTWMRFFPLIFLWYIYVSNS